MILPGLLNAWKVRHLGVAIPRILNEPILPPMLVLLAIVWLLPHTPIPARVQHRIASQITQIPKVQVDFHRQKDFASRYSTNKTALYIEPRASVKHTTPLLVHMMEVVPSEWHFIFLGSHASVAAARISGAVKRYEDWGKLRIGTLDQWTSAWGPRGDDLDVDETHSRLLTNASFYERELASVEHLFVFHSEGILCANSHRDLNDWLEYDWVGAPWNNAARFGGTGGLSLRRVSRTLEVLRFQSRLDYSSSEDVWLSSRIGLLPGANMAPPVLEREFAVEEVWADRPMGYHLSPAGLSASVWESPEQRKMIFEHCPEIKIILDMRLERERCSLEYTPGSPLIYFGDHLPVDEAEPAYSPVKQSVINAAKIASQKCQDRSEESFNIAHSNPWTLTCGTMSAFAQQQLSASTLATVGDSLLSLLGNSNNKRQRRRGVRRQLASKCGNCASIRTMALPQNSSHQTFQFVVNSPETRPDQSNQAVRLPKVGGEKKQITRNRASYSCKTCRKRKIKCDKVHPACGNCTKNQERCIYGSGSQSSSALPEANPETVRHNAKRRKADGNERDTPSEESSPSSVKTAANDQLNPAIEDRLDRLTALVEALGRGKAEEAATPWDSGFGLRQENVTRGEKDSLATSRRDGDVLLHADAISERRQNGESQPRSGSSGPASKTPSYEFDLPTDSIELEDPLSKLNLGYLSVQEGGRSRYVGSTWWAFVSDELEQLNILLKDQNRYLNVGRVGNRQYGQREDMDDRSESSASEASHDSHLPNSFHKSGDYQHHQKSQFREDCPACRSHATDKFMLLQALDAHPSRFAKMDSDMVAGVPEESASHVLFRCWISGVHAYHPLMYPPIVLEKYNLFWEWYKNGRTTGIPHPCPSFMPFIYAVWYAGSVSLSIKGLRRWFPGTTRAALSAKLHDQATRCLALTSFPRNASLPQLAALLMLQIIPANEEEPFTISIFVGLAIRVAHTLGLHREPSLFNMEPWMAEARRRMFWQIYQMDIYIAVTSGLPPMMNEDFFDTRMVSEVKDLLLGTKEGDEYEAATARGERPLDNPDNPSTRNWDSMVSVSYMVARARYTTTHALSKVLRIHLGTTPIKREDMIQMRNILAKVDRQLNETIRRIPTKGIPELGFVPDLDEKGRSLVADHDLAQGKAPTEEDIRHYTGMTPRNGQDGNTSRYHWNTLIAFHKFSRIVLSLLIDKMYCVSFLPLLKNAKSKFWSCARQCALRSCHGYMRKFLALASDPAFQPFQWSWPGMNQPMHAAMIMLVDLYERPFSVEAPRSRAFIDKVFSMSGPDGGIVSGEDGVANMRPLREGGREAWELLRKLREKAWERAGLDHEVLWTEESQINAGVAQPLTEAQRTAQSLREDLIHVDTNTLLNGSAPVTSSSAAGLQQIISSAVNDILSSPDRSAQQASNETAAQPPQSQPPATHTEGGLPTLHAGGPAPLLSSSNQAPAPPLAPPPTGSSYLDPRAAASTNPDDSAPTMTRTATIGAKETAAPSPAFEHQHHDEDFWNRWDSVLGSHAGFEDLMEDIRWDDLGTGDDVNLI